MRLGRITASNFGPMIATINHNRFPPSLFSTLLGKHNLEGVKSIQWGINHEEHAVKLFEEAIHLKVVPTGLWLHTSGVLGASPDGLIGDSAIIEIKCPFKYRVSTIGEIEKDTKYFIDNEGNLKTTHPFYHQIQGQLNILNRELCYLVIWTTKETLIINVNRDPNWDINISNLSKFCSYYKDRLMN